MTQDITVLLADDHNIVRSGLRALLQSEAGFSVIGEASNGRTVLELPENLSPNVVVMDVQMPDLNGIDATRQILARRNGVKVIGFSAGEDERSAIEMLRAGAVGYVAKNAAYEELIAAIRTVMAGNVYFSPSVISRVADDGATPADRFLLQVVALNSKRRPRLGQRLPGRWGPLNNFLGAKRAVRSLFYGGRREMTLNNLFRIF
jgi:DNA-binding NarL/FixJ family response regulator